MSRLQIIDQSAHPNQALTMWMSLVSSLIKINHYYASSQLLGTLDAEVVSPVNVVLQRKYFWTTTMIEVLGHPVCLEEIALLFQGSEVTQVGL